MTEIQKEVNTDTDSNSNPIKGVVGLRNLGMTCYANSAIQSLRMNTEMTMLCLDENSGMKKTNDLTSGKLFESYKDLIKTMWSASHPAFVSPDAFWRDLLTAADEVGYEHFRRREPQDAHEFLMFLLDQIYEGTKEEVHFIIQRPPPTNPMEVRVQKALEAWKNQFEKQYTPIVDVWFGLFEFETECQNCKSSFFRYECFNTLKINVPQHLPNGEPPSIQEMLAEDLKPEMIEGYQCDKCTPYRYNAIRRCRIWRMPRCLVVMLKRFLPDGKKIHTSCKFSSDEELSFREFFSEASPERSKDYIYKLQSCIDHHGSARGGHYTAQALSPLDGKWALYDDENATIIEKPFIGPSSYVLMFRAKPQA